jgi:hypothetical protein
MLLLWGRKEKINGFGVEPMNITEKLAIFKIFRPQNEQFSEGRTCRWREIRIKQRWSNKRIK